VFMGVMAWGLEFRAQSVLRLLQNIFPFDTCGCGHVWTFSSSEDGDSVSDVPVRFIEVPVYVCTFSCERRRYSGGLYFCKPC